MRSLSLSLLGQSSKSSSRTAPKHPHLARNPIPVAPPQHPPFVLLDAPLPVLAAPMPAFPPRVSSEPLRLLLPSRASLRLNARVSSSLPRPFFREVQLVAMPVLLDMDPAAVLRKYGYALPPRSPAAPSSNSLDSSADESSTHGPLGPQPRLDRRYNPTSGAPASLDLSVVEHWNENSYENDDNQSDPSPPPLLTLHTHPSPTASPLPYLHEPSPPFPHPSPHAFRPLRLLKRPELSPSAADPGYTELAEPGMPMFDLRDAADPSPPNIPLPLHLLHRRSPPPSHPPTPRRMAPPSRPEPVAPLRLLCAASDTHLPSLRAPRLRPALPVDPIAAMDRPSPGAPRPPLRLLSAPSPPSSAGLPLMPQPEPHGFLPIISVAPPASRAEPTNPNGDARVPAALPLLRIPSRPTAAHIPTGSDQQRQPHIVELLVAPPVVIPHDPPPTPAQPRPVPFRPSLIPIHSGEDVDVPAVLTQPSSFRSRTRLPSPVVSDEAASAAADAYISEVDLQLLQARDQPLPHHRPSYFVSPDTPHLSPSPPVRLLSVAYPSPPPLNPFQHLAYATEPFEQPDPYTPSPPPIIPNPPLDLLHLDRRIASPYPEPDQSEWSSHNQEPETEQVAVRTTVAPMLVDQCVQADAPATGQISAQPVPLADPAPAPGPPHAALDETLQRLLEEQEKDRGQLAGELARLSAAVERVAVLEQEQRSSKPNEVSQQLGLLADRMDRMQHTENLNHTVDRLVQLLQREREHPPAPMPPPAISEMAAAAMERIADALQVKDQLHSLRSLVETALTQAATAATPLPAPPLTPQRRAVIDAAAQTTERTSSPPPAVAVPCVVLSVQPSSPPDPLPVVPMEPASLPVPLQPSTDPTRHNSPQPQLHPWTSPAPSAPAPPPRTSQTATQASPPTVPMSTTRSATPAAAIPMAPTETVVSWMAAIPASASGRRYLHIADFDQSALPRLPQQLALERGVDDEMEGRLAVLQRQAEFLVIEEQFNEFKAERERERKRQQQQKLREVVDRFDSHIKNLERMADSIDHDLHASSNLLGTVEAAEQERQRWKAQQLLENADKLDQGLMRVGHELKDAGNLLTDLEGHLAPRDSIASAAPFPDLVPSISSHNPDGDISSSAVGVLGAQPSDLLADIDIGVVVNNAGRGDYGQHRSSTMEYSEAVSTSLAPEVLSHPEVAALDEGVGESLQAGHWSHNGDVRSWDSRPVDQSGAEEAVANGGRIYGDGNHNGGKDSPSDGDPSEPLKGSAQRRRVMFTDEAVDDPVSGLPAPEKENGQGPVPVRSHGEDGRKTWKGSSNQVGGRAGRQSTKVGMQVPHGGKTVHASASAARRLKQEQSRKAKEKLRLEEGLRQRLQAALQTLADVYEVKHRT